MTDAGKYKYSGYSIGSDSHSEISLIYGSMGRNIINFGAYISSSVYVDNENKNILILGALAAQGFDDTILRAEAKYLISFTQPNKRFKLRLHYNENNSFLFVNATKLYQFKAKDSATNHYTLGLDNSSKDFTINIMKKTGFGGVVKFFFVFNPININDILGYYK